MNLNLPMDMLPSSNETGTLKIKHLKRFWKAAILAHNNKGRVEREDEWQIDTTLLAALNLGLEQTMIYLYQTAPSFEDFESWIIANAGLPDVQKVRNFNASLSDKKILQNELPTSFFSEKEMAFWEMNGYVIVKNAVSREDCEKAIEVICDFINIRRDDPETWYHPHPARQGIMVQLFQHPVLQKNRSSEKIKMAFEHLWQRKDIWLNTDRVGFNPPETPTWHFPGPNMHWDCKLNTPIPFGTQGILYLADTEPDQGAFTLVPGFQHQVDEWLNNLPDGIHAHQIDLHSLGSTPIAAQAGDFIIWQQALPHGSSPNLSAKPRFVQYINYEPMKR